jgi:DhnA-type fructose-1,6-bisphosphate aldolase and related enzymes
MLFAGDHKIEHLFDPLLTPEHLFNIASKGDIGAFATQLGLIERYAHAYPGINYIVKLNSKTDSLPIEHYDPISEQLWSIDDVIQVMENTQAAIRGVGYTIYIGSEYEHIMLQQAAHIIQHAQAYGLITVLWMYPRGKSIVERSLKDEFDNAQLLRGATGIANALGADFVKIHPPHNTADLPTICAAAGNTRVICSGGIPRAPEDFLTAVHAQLGAGSAGCAAGRNIFHHALPEAIALTRATSALVYKQCGLKTALALYQKK